MFSFWQGLNLKVGLDLGQDQVRLTTSLSKPPQSVPSLAAVNKRTRGVVALGKEAEAMWGRTPVNVDVIRLVERGRLVDIDLTGLLVQQLLPFNNRRWLAPFPSKLVCSVGPSLNSIEKRAFIQMGRKLGFRQVFLVDKVILAAMGEGWDVFSSQGRLIMYFGAGTSFISLLSMGGKIKEVSLEFGWMDLVDKLIKYLRDNYHFLTGWNQANALIRKLSSPGIRLIVRGFDFNQRKLTSLRLEAGEVEGLVLSWMDVLIDKLTQMVADLPTEFLPEVSRQGILITGGGIKLTGLKERIVKRLKMPVAAAVQPETAVINGLSRLLSNKQALFKLKMAV